MLDILMPALGENVKEGLVVNVFVQPDDTLHNGQTLIEVETDKVTFEVPVEVSGKLIDLFVKKGDTVQPGDLLGRVDGGLPETGIPPAQPSPAGNEALPGEVVHDHQVNADTHDHPVEYPEGKNGVLSPVETQKILSTPLARKLARELDIPISSIGGMGNKRISFNDVKVFAKDRLRQFNHKKPNSRPDTVAPPLPDFGKFGKVRHQEMTPIMAATSRNMTISAGNIPHAWLQEKADITNLETQRQKHKEIVKSEGGSLTITVLITKAVASALQAFPFLNASIDTDKNEVILKEYYHIGIAVDTDRGLLVPVIRNAEKRNLTSLAIELIRISKEVKERKIKPEDLEGATFTISNVGGIGTTGMNPLVSWPQVAILGLSASEWESVWTGNAFTARLRLPLCLGFDHRLINGAYAAKFLQYLKKILEDPFLLLL